ncbi:MLP1_2 [Sanghuangporus weigelae]
MFTLNIILTGHESGKVALFDAKAGEETLNRKHSQLGHALFREVLRIGRLTTLEAQLESTQASYQATIRAYIKVRDTLKTMISRYDRGRALPATTSTQQAGPSSPQANVSVREPTELEKAPEEVRTNFEAYRKEMGVGAIKLREVLQYQRESSQLRAAFAKANARIEFLNGEFVSFVSSTGQAHHLGQSGIARLRNSASCTSEKLKICRNGTDNSSANTQIERLRNECSILRAEKKIWENVRTRLIDENKVLSLERSRMADLIANMRKMHNDIDKANGR